MDGCEAGDHIARKSTNICMDGDGVHKDLYSYTFTGSKRWDIVQMANY